MVDEASNAASMGCIDDQLVGKGEKIYSVAAALLLAHVCNCSPDYLPTILHQQLSLLNVLCKALSDLRNCAQRLKPLARQHLKPAVGSLSNTLELDESNAKRKELSSGKKPVR